uniref:Uncharacterized protein n=1 Tax=Tanacetum cinerariifolium TaxID=118510 RepID=A0A6L2KZY9_TANCI|nr:hypothetical protein [Tanacetum cinerariifolium]
MMIERMIHTVKTDMMIHTVKTEMMRLVVEIECVGKIADAFDKETRSSDGLQPEGLGYESYHAVPPPPTWLFSHLKLDLSNSRLEEFKQPEFESYGPKTYKIESKNTSADIPNELMKSPDAPLVKDIMSFKRFFTHTNMFVDHMHQPWRTLATIINKCLSEKTTSNDKLCKSRIDILYGMFYGENVNYTKLIWEYLAFMIDHRKENISRRENMPLPRFTKIIINHFLKQHKSLSNLKYQHYHTIKDDEQESEYSEEDQLDDEEKDNKDRDADDKGDDHISDNQDANDKDAESESESDEIYKYKIRMHIDKDKEVLNAEVEDSDKGDHEDDAKKTELPPTSSSLSVSSCLVLTPVQESPSIATVTTLPPPSISTTPLLRVAKLEKDVSELNKIDLSAEALTALKT